MKKCRFWQHDWHVAQYVKYIGTCLTAVDYSRGNSSIYERCSKCGKERPTTMTVIHSSEAPMPWYTCKCGKGNEEHRLDAIRRVQEIRNRHQRNF